MASWRDAERCADKRDVCHGQACGPCTRGAGIMERPAAALQAACTTHQHQPRLQPISVLTFCFFLSCLALMRESMLSRRLQWEGSGTNFVSVACGCVRLIVQCSQQLDINGCAMRRARQTAAAAAGSPQAHTPRSTQAPCSLLLLSLLLLRLRPEPLLPDLGLLGLQLGLLLRQNGEARAEGER